MITRIVATLLSLLFIATTASANKELSIKLDSKERVQSERLGFAYITFEYLYPNGNNARVRVSIENITGNPPHAVLIFKNGRTEQDLKRTKPKIEFEKTYPGKKGSRVVRGCREANEYMDIIPAAQTDTVFTIDVPFTSSRDFILPLYEAKYKAKDLFKKGEDNINYKILEEHLYQIHIEVVGWSEDDPAYTNMKDGVEEYISSLKDVEFCYHKKHTPTLKEQQRPYQEQKDSLIACIRNILQPKIDKTEWMSEDAPYIAYNQLLTKLNKVDLNDYAKDCGQHKPQPRTHSCNYCSLNSQDIYHRLDDIYQQLHAGKITKDQALKSARGLYNCYRQSKERKKDSSYGTKISRFYNSITNY